MATPSESDLMSGDEGPSTQELMLLHYAQMMEVLRWARGDGPAQSESTPSSDLMSDSPSELMLNYAQMREVLRIFWAGITLEMQVLFTSWRFYARV